MTDAGDKLAEAARGVVPDDGESVDFTELVIRIDNLRASLAAYDAGKAVRDAEQQLVQWVLDSDVREWPSINMCKQAVLAARAQAEVKP